MSETSTSHEQAMKKTHTRLKTNALNFWEILAQAVALISPSMTAALIVPLMFGTAGTAGWLCYLFGTIMLLFVAFSLNQFSRRYTSAGSMYEYTVKGLGPKTGGLSGWSLIWAYMFIGIAGVTGFTHFATKLLALTSACRLSTGGAPHAGHTRVKSFLSDPHSAQVDSVKRSSFARPIRCRCRASGPDSHARPHG